MELSLPIRVSLNDDGTVGTAGQTTSQSIIVSLNWAVVHFAVVDGADNGLSRDLPTDRHFRHWRTKISTGEIASDAFRH